MYFGVRDPDAECEKGSSLHWEALRATTCCYLDLLPCNNVHKNITKYTLNSRLPNRNTQLLLVDSGETKISWEMAYNARPARTSGNVTRFVLVDDVASVGILAHSWATGICLHGRLAKLSNALFYISAILAHKQRLIHPCLI